MGALLAWLEAHATYRGDDCIRWPYAYLPNGYAPVTFRGRRTLASRVLCVLAHGEPPEPTYEAAHSCGNGARGCLNPRHLSWKTRLENQADRLEHGTVVRGEKQPRSKLKESDVRRIRALIGTATQAEIGRMFGVAQCTVSEIKTGRKWGWLV